MKKQPGKYIVLLALITSALWFPLKAQDLQIHKTDGSLITLPLDLIESITFHSNGGLFVCGTSTITDADNNVYTTVQIGNQCWMGENLKTTHYRNGTPIENPGSNGTAWNNNTNGAYSWIENNTFWKDLYGALYNWHAVNNPNGLCPEGWRVPSDEDFNFLFASLDPATIPGIEGVQSYSAGGKMKSTLTEPSPHPRWRSPNTGATNESNWNGLPAGNRSTLSYFLHLGNNAFYWSSTEHDSDQAWYRYIYYNDASAYRYNLFKNRGLSVRCLLDQNKQSEE
jgi:uncharacterized protein (TIGR02145 family)